MCDYSLHAVASRPAEVAETLVSTKFRSTTTRRFASPDKPNGCGLPSSRNRTRI